MNLLSRESKERSNAVRYKYTEASEEFQKKLGIGRIFKNLCMHMISKEQVTDGLKFNVKNKRGSAKQEWSNKFLQNSLCY